MGLYYIGDATFADLFVPVPGKNEWGVDTLTRKMSGSRAGLATFNASLAQGQPFTGYPNFFLQSWSPDDNPAFATVTLIYKGLLSGTPPPIVINEIVTSGGNKSHDFTAGGTIPKGVQYGQDAAGNPLFALNASMDFTYRAGQTIYRYIKVGQPQGPQYTVLGFTFTPSILGGRVTTSDGATFGVTSVPFAIGPSLLPTTITEQIGFTSQPIVGTPYFECQDIVRTGYQAG